MRNELPRPELPPDTLPDLQTQLEDLLHAVWLAEADWRLDERISLAMHTRRLTHRRIELRGRGREA